MKVLRATFFLAALVPCSLAACSGEDGSSSSSGSADVAFHGEVRPFAGVDLDTGMQPPLSPVQVSLAFAIDGALTVDAAAVTTGAADAPGVVAKPGSGTQKLAGKLRADAKIKIDLSPAKYEGPLPGIEALNVLFDGTSTFDPFLLEKGSTRATAQLPETKLPPIPLPGGVPGSIVLTIEKGSFVRSDFHGTCASVTHGSPSLARYVGAAKLDGELVVKATVELKAPLSKKFDIPSFKVTLPQREVPVDLGEVEVKGGGEAPAGGTEAPVGKACSASAAGPRPSSDAGTGDAAAPDDPPGDPTDPGDPPPDPGPMPDGGGASCAPLNTCSAAQVLGTIAGDGTGLATPLTASGTTGKWLVFRVKETDTGVLGKNLKVKATLTPPPGSQWTFAARFDKDNDVSAAAACSAKTYTPSLNALVLEWGEGFGANGGDDSRNIVVEVKHVGGACPPSAPWGLKLERVAN